MSKYYRSLAMAVGEDGAPYVELKRRIVWGQSPDLAMHYHRPELGEVKGIAYDGGPGVDDLMGGKAGALEVGDRVRFLMGVAPAIRRPVRVEVVTHDGRLVGHSQNRVWIVWPGVREGRKTFRIVKGGK